MARFERGVRMGREDNFIRREGGAYIVEVCPKQDFSFGFNAATPASFIPLVAALPVYDWTSGLLVVRLHAISWIASTFAVEVRNVSISPDDPATIFQTGTAVAPGPTIASVSWSSAPSAPLLVPAVLGVPAGSPIGPMLEVGLRATGTASGTLRATLSIDLVGRTG